MPKTCNGSSSEPLTVNIKDALLARLERYCEKKDLTKSQVVSKALKSFLAAEMALDDPAFWTAVYDKYESEGKL